MRHPSLCRKVGLSREVAVHQGQPAGRLVPRRLFYLGQPVPWHALDKEPVALEMRLDDCSVACGRAQFAGLEDSSIGLNLPERIVEKGGLDPAYVLQQGLVAQVLTQELHGCAIVKIDI